MDTVLQVIRDEPVPPRRLNPSIPRDLETICLKCLEKSQARRYASASDLAAELAALPCRRADRARPVTRPERAVKWARRKPAIAGLLGLVSLVTGSGSAACSGSGARQFGLATSPTRKVETPGTRPILQKAGALNRKTVAKRPSKPGRRRNFKPNWPSNVCMTCG